MTDRFTFDLNNLVLSKNHLSQRDSSILTEFKVELSKNGNTNFFTDKMPLLYTPTFHILTQDGL